MRTLVLDCNAGSEATRIVAALLDVGGDESPLHDILNILPWAAKWRLEVLRMPIAGLLGTCVRLHAPGEGREMAPGYGYEHDHDWDAPGAEATPAAVWGQIHEHDQLIQGLLPEWYAGFTPEQAQQTLAALELSCKARAQVEQMLWALAAMRQAQPSGEIKRHELLVMLFAVLALESLQVDKTWTTPVCVGGSALSRVILGTLAQGRLDLPELVPEGRSVGYGHDGRESPVPDVLRACLGYPIR